ncbi:MAG TPA: hypothetical protein GXX36_09920 [Clostridiaceae bacterium]|nr:hypothetical protein [Clostridiaceae bacterium]
MKTKLLCLLMVLCIMLGVVPVSAAEAPVIAIITQPAAETVVTKGEISGKLYVNASASDGSELSYQWYRSTFSDTNTLGLEIPGATSAEFTIPADITSDKYYFCEVRAKGAAPVRTNVAKVFVKNPKTVITITKQPEKITTVYEKSIRATLTVEASATNHSYVQYQWYSNTKNSNVGGTRLEGSLSKNKYFNVPFDLKVGTYYYYCIITSSDADPVRSEVATVIVEPEPTTIKIYRQPQKTVEQYR